MVRIQFRRLSNKNTLRQKISANFYISRVIEPLISEACASRNSLSPITKLKTQFFFSLSMSSGVVGNPEIMKKRKVGTFAGKSNQESSMIYFLRRKTTSRSTCGSSRPLSSFSMLLYSILAFPYLLLPFFFFFFSFSFLSFSFFFLLPVLVSFSVFSSSDSSAGSGSSSLPTI